MIRVGLALAIGGGFLAAGPGAAADATTGARARSAVIETVLRELRDRYVFPDVALAMDAAIRERLRKSEYNAVVDAAEFAEKLTADLQAVSRDKHLRVRRSAVGGRSAAVPRRSDNHGFARVEQMAGNVGYIDLRAFAAGREAAKKANETMAALADTDALVIDLRQNGGGSPEMIILLCSYLLRSEPVLLNSFIGRDGQLVSESWTLKNVPGPRYTDKDVYVLTSGYTFSAAEEFAYDLANLKRATLIGEVTGGGANPVDRFQIDDEFEVTIPTARALNPITKTNWEGTGVKPDIEVPAAEALHTAHTLALEKLAHRGKPLEGIEPSRNRPARVQG